LADGAGASTDEDGFVFVGAHSIILENGLKIESIRHDVIQA
jgi:hypothetical protein